MSNYCDETYYQQNIYTNTYSLWENSAYYDINNLSPQNYSSSWHRGNDEDFETRYTSGPTVPEPVEPPDHSNRRIVEKSSLYEDPDLFYQDVTYTMSCSLFSDDNSTPPPTSEWGPWQNSGEDSEEGSSGWSNFTGRTNNAVNMMQLMGWHGIPLSITGTSIVEPVTPNAVYSQSEGEQPNPNLPIYQEAPKQVYLIIPDDLREDPPSEDPSTEPSTSKDEGSDNEAEEETNPFLRSITRNLKKTKDVEKTQKLPVTLAKETNIIDKILEYFSDFAEKEQYSQFKFLGQFSNEELDAIRGFMEKSTQHLNDEATEYKEIFGKVSFEICEDITGNTVINKVLK